MKKNVSAFRILKKKSPSDQKTVPIQSQYFHSCIQKLVDEEYGERRGNQSSCCIMLRGGVVTERFKSKS